MIIFLNFLKETNLNKLAIDIKFQIIIDEFFPFKPPIVYCLSNYVFPTIFDFRDLLTSIIKIKWTKNSSIEDIISNIPDFITRTTENCLTNILVYYGEYKIDEIYNMNDFLSNEDLIFIKCFEYFDKNKKKNSKIKKERYILLTNIYFLLFEPIEGNKNLALLLFWGDIRQLLNFRIENIKENKQKKDCLVLEWKSGEKIIISFYLTFKDISLKEFSEISLDKINEITSIYKTFQDDIWKINEDEKIFNYKNKEYLLNVISIKEGILKERKNKFQIEELTLLYKKIIEILSGYNDPLYEKFISKLKKIIEEEL